ncbi:hypothetical protein AAFC00_000962 [Neodothiora populina]|uniref:BTB domain-containing protein n=1 Tax=Neodothiora populina TaxID=2781224 RepID=A0ABR3PNC6_9PEZI
MSDSQSLSVPTGTGRPINSRSNSANSMQRPVERVEVAQDLVAQRRMRADSSQSVNNSGVADVTEEGRPNKITLPARQAASSSDLRSGLSSPVIPDGAVQKLISSIHADNQEAKTPLLEDLPQTTFFVGPFKKPFKAHNYLLIKKVPLFRKLLSSYVAPKQEQLTFETLDEFAAAIFIRWLYGGKLHGPTDFHSMHHYLALYVLGFTWDVEDLCNGVMDLVRAYYRHESMTAPAFRLEYIYTMTQLPNAMRNFLTQTAAFRVLYESPLAPGVYLSPSIKGVISKSPDLAVDFAEALVKLSRNDINDPRRGDNCKWHEHSDGKLCLPMSSEPYE